MGKKQHQSDKLYLSATEWKTYYGGKKAADSKSKSDFKRLPFDCCSIALTPFENPLCTKEGVIFDLMSILPFMKKYGVNPVTGDKMTSKELIRLKFHKNAQDKYHCPVTFKVFNENTHIVAIKPTGNVYAYEAIEKLNIVPQYFKDLLSDEPFTRKEIITIQDPNNLDKFNISAFYYLKKNLKLSKDDGKELKERLKHISPETRDILAQLERDYIVPKAKTSKKAASNAISAAHYSTGRVAMSLTSTVMGIETVQQAATVDEDILRYERVKKKAYVRMVTSHGYLNLELHSDMVPKTCENFMKHAQNGYYNGTIFHRSIKHFVLQGGDPEGTGKGGASIWGEPFRDDFKPNLTHNWRGVVSMANSGPHTNKSQFFITYKSCHHLDNKHTVFGRVVGGIETLAAIEKIKVDKNDKPEEEVRIDGFQIYLDPYEEADEQLIKEREELKVREKKEAEAAKQKCAVVKPTGPQRVFKSGVGKYLNPSTIKRAAAEGSDGPVSKKVKNVPGKFGNFSGW